MSQKQKLSCDSLSVEQPPLKKCRDTTEDSNKHSWVCDYCKAPFPSYDEASLHEQTCSKRGLVENGDPVQNTMPPYYPPAVVNKNFLNFVNYSRRKILCLRIIRLL